MSAPGVPRSYLFVPGDRPERFDKAAAAGADRIILDLEDAVLAEAKGAARDHVRAWLNGGGRAVVRVNGLDTEWHEADMGLTSLPGLDGVMLPKAEPSVRLTQLAASLDGCISLIPLVETASGVQEVRAIAALPGVERLAFGSVDYAADLGISAEDDLALQLARSTLVVASRAAGIGAPVDGVTLALQSPERLAADVALARRLGMTGKLCIHPAQVAAVNAGFEPTPAEIAAARRIVAAAESSGGRGAVRLDNKLIDKPVVDRARQVLARLGDAASIE